jgi:hypothetical protein
VASSATRALFQLFPAGIREMLPETGSARCARARTGRIAARLL